MRVLTAILFLWAALAAPAWAVNPDEMLDDPTLESRAKDIGKGLRCLVCQNESIEDSNAELAGDLRRLVRERVTAGDSNAEVIDYVVSRYGDFVLLKPPVKAETLILWIGPAAILALGLFGLVMFYRRRGPETATPGETAAPRASDLSAEELKRVEALLKDDDR